MFKAPRMRVSDYTCMLCGSKLELTMKVVCVGDNCGTCPMCGEPYTLNITIKEMNEFEEIERELKGNETKATDH